MIDATWEHFPHIANDWQNEFSLTPNRLIRRSDERNKPMADRFRRFDLPV